MAIRYLDETSAAPKVRYLDDAPTSKVRYLEEAPSHPSTPAPEVAADNNFRSGTPAPAVSVPAPNRDPIRQEQAQAVPTPTPIRPAAADYAGDSGGSGLVVDPAYPKTIASPLASVPKIAPAALAVQEQMKIDREAKAVQAETARQEARKIPMTDEPWIQAPDKTVYADSMPALPKNRLSQDGGAVQTNADVVTAKAKKAAADLIAKQKADAERAIRVGVLREDALAGPQGGTSKAANVTDDELLKNYSRRSDRDPIKVKLATEIAKRLNRPLDMNQEPMSRPVAEELASSVRRGVGGLASPIETAQRAVAQFAAPQGGSAIASADVAKRFAPDPALRRSTNLTLGETIAYGAVESIPQLAAQVAAAYATGGSSLAFAGTAVLPVMSQSYNQTYDAVIANGGTPEEANASAFSKAAVDGLVTGLTSKAEFAFLQGNPAAQNTIRNFLTNRVRGVVAEGGQESVEQIGQELTDYVVRAANDMTPIPFEQRLQNVLMAGATGGVAGGFLPRQNRQPPATQTAAAPTAPAAPPRSSPHTAESLARLKARAEQERVRVPSDPSHPNYGYHKDLAEKAEKQYQSALSEATTPSQVTATPKSTVNASVDIPEAPTPTEDSGSFVQQAKAEIDRLLGPYIKIVDPQTGNVIQEASFAPNDVVEKVQRYRQAIRDRQSAPSIAAPASEAEIPQTGPTEPAPDNIPQDRQPDAFRETARTGSYPSMSDEDAEAMLDAEMAKLQGQPQAPDAAPVGTPPPAGAVLASPTTVESLSEAPVVSTPNTPLSPLPKGDANQGAVSNTQDTVNLNSPIQETAPVGDQPPTPQPINPSSEVSDGVLASQDKMTRRDVSRVLASQPNNAGKSEESLAEKWIASESFTLVEIPIDSVGVASEAKGKSTTSGPIIVDKNINEVGRLEGQYGSPPIALVIDGKHRLSEAKARGEKTIFAMVGNEVEAMLKSKAGAFKQKTSEIAAATKAFIDAPNGTTLRALSAVASEEEVKAARSLVAKNRESSKANLSSKVKSSEVSVVGDQSAPPTPPNKVVGGKTSKAKPKPAKVDVELKEGETTPAVVGAKIEVFNSFGDKWEPATITRVTKNGTRLYQRDDGSGFGELNPDSKSGRTPKEDAGLALEDEGVANQIKAIISRVGDVRRLSGNSGAEARQRLMSLALGREATKAESGINALASELYRFAGIKEGSAAGMSNALAEWSKTAPSFISDPLPSKFGEVYRIPIAGKQGYAVRVNTDNPRGGGDTILWSMEDAQKESARLIEQKAASEKSKAESDRLAAEEKAKTDKIAEQEADIDGFGSELSPMALGKVVKTLNSQIRKDGKVKTIKEHVRDMVAAGDVKLSTFEESVIKPMSRTAFNRATNQEQAAHEKKMKAGGTKPVYLVNDSVLGKTAYDYAKYLIENKPKADAAPTPIPLSPPSETAPKSETVVGGKTEGQPSGEVDAKPGEMTSKEFYKVFGGQHTLLRDAGEETISSLIENGFRGGIGPNVMEITKGPPTDVMERRYGTKAGATVVVIPKSAIKDTGNGPRIKDGFKPTRDMFVKIKDDYEPLYDAFVRQQKEQGQPSPISKQEVSAGDVGGKPGILDRLEAKVDEKIKKIVDDQSGKALSGVDPNSVKMLGLLTAKLGIKLSKAAVKGAKAIRDAFNAMFDTAMANLKSQGVDVAGFESRRDEIFERAVKASESIRNEDGTINPDKVQEVANEKWLADDAPKTVSIAAPESEADPISKATEMNEDETFSARQVDTDATRASVGLDEMPSPERKTWADALKKAKRDKLATTATAKALEIIKKPYAMNDLETAAMVVKGQELKIAHKMRLKEVDKMSDGGKLATVDAELAAIENELDIITTAIRLSGTEKGRGLAAQKLTINEQFDLVSMLNRAKAKKGSALTPEERQAITDLQKKNDELTKRIEALERGERRSRAEGATQEARTSRRAPKDIQSKVDKLKALMQAGCAKG